MKKVKGREILKYVLIFIYFFLCLQIFFQMFCGDLIYNYGFSYAIAKGEIPYLDFNMIVTPFSSFLYTIPLKIFGTHLIVLNLFQALLCAIMFYLLFKMFDKKAYLLLIASTIMLPIPLPTVFFEGYNFILLFELVLLLYLEKIKANDYVIGLVLGLSFLTKQTVGLCLCLPTLYYLFKDYKKVLKRIGGFFIPIIIFIIYLLITNSFNNFIDQCFLGMFDFTNKNCSKFTWYLVLSILLVIINIYLIIKDKKNINNYYVLAFVSIVLPLIDYSHVALYLFAIIMLLCVFYKESKSIHINTLIVCSLLPIIWFLFFFEFKMPNFVSDNHFEGYIINKKKKINNDLVSSYIKKNNDKRIILLNEWAYYIKIINDLDIECYDLINMGNNGYNSTDKIINKINKEEDAYFIINMNEYNLKNSGQQIDKEVLKYVIDNYKKVDNFGNYVIYYKE